MTTKQSRKSISISGALYTAFKAWCAERNLSLSSVTENTLRAHIGMEPRPIIKSKKEKQAEALAAKLEQIKDPTPAAVEAADELSNLWKEEYQPEPEPAPIDDGLLLYNLARTFQENFSASPSTGKSEGFSLPLAPADPAPAFFRESKEEAKVAKPAPTPARAPYRDNPMFMSKAQREMREREEKMRIKRELDSDKEIPPPRQPSNIFTF